MDAETIHGLFPKGGTERRPGSTQESFCRSNGLLFRILQRKASSPLSPAQHLANALEFLIFELRVGEHSCDSLGFSVASRTFSTCVPCGRSLHTQGWRRGSRYFIAPLYCKPRHPTSLHSQNIVTSGFPCLFKKNREDTQLLASGRELIKQTARHTRVRARTGLTKAQVKPSVAAWPGVHSRGQQKYPAFTN